ncbi:hypothetical protein BDW72DRAFT_183361 [Aspergillus terricola var. indicus]
MHNRSQRYAMLCLSVCACLQTRRDGRVMADCAAKLLQQRLENLVPCENRRSAEMPRN